MATVLVVDDAVFMRRMLSDIFKKEGHQVVGEAENAKEAVTLYKKLKPDFVTLDIIMPEIDKVDSMKAVQEILSFDKQAAILMVSAMGQQQIVVEAIRTGAKDFIVKPFQASNVVNVVNRVLREKH